MTGRKQEPGMRRGDATGARQPEQRDSLTSPFFCCCFKRHPRKREDTKEYSGRTAGRESFRVQVVEFSLQAALSLSRLKAELRTKNVLCVFAVSFSYGRCSA